MYYYCANTIATYRLTVYNSMNLTLMVVICDSQLFGTANIDWKRLSPTTTQRVKQIERDKSLHVKQ